MPPVWSLAPRKLSCHDIIFVRGGSGTFFCDGFRRTVTAPGWVVFPAGLKQAIHGRNLVLEVVHLDARLGAQVDALKVFCPENVLAPQFPPETEELFHRGIDSWLERSVVGQVSANRWMELWFARAYGRGANVRRLDSRLVNTLAGFHSHSAGPFLLRDAARRAGVSTAHLRNLFHRHLGASPKRILQEIRLDHARRLLEDGETGVADAAHQAGWEDTSGFSKSFRRRFGINPGAFRRLNAESHFG